MFSSILRILGPVVRMVEKAVNYLTSPAKKVAKRIKRDKKWNKSMREKNKKELSKDDFLK